MKRYRLEVFSRDLQFKSFAEVAEPEIYIDCLVQTDSIITCPKQVTCARGDFAQIRIDGTVYYQGIITDFNYDGYKTEITMQQLSALLDVEVFASVKKLNNGTKDIETWFSDLLTSTFGGTDTFQNLTGLTFIKNSSTTGSKKAEDKNIYNLYELAVYFFKTYGVITDVSFDFTTQKITFEFSSVSASTTKLSLNVTDVESFDIEPSLSETAPNKMIIRNDEDSTEELTYYWHPSTFSGTVNTNGSTNRVVPVIVKCETVTVDEGDTFAAASLASARNSMYQSRYDDLITVTIRADSNLVTISNVGQQFILYADGNTYYTVLTGIHAVNMKYIQCTFGYVRKRLTQILRMKGK